MQAKFKGTQHSILNKILSENHFLNIVIALMLQFHDDNITELYFGSPWIGPCSLYFYIFKGRLFAWTLSIYMPNLKFVALRVPEIIGVLKNFRKSLDTPTLLLGLLFAWTLWIYLPNLKCVALPIPEIIGNTEKNSAVPGYANAAFSPKFLKGFCCDKPFEYTCQIWSS